MTPHLCCSNCRSDLPAENVNIQNLIAKCHKCNCVFSIANQILEPNPQLLGPEPSRPNGITVSGKGAFDLEFKINWFNSRLIFMAFFCVAWDGFLVFWYAIGIANIGTDDFSWMMLLFPLLHVAAGISLTYYTVAGFLNSTIVHIHKDEMSIEHGPVPWPGNKTLIASDIENLELDFDRYTDETEKNMVVTAHHNDGHPIILFRNLGEHQSQFIAWQIANAFELPLIRNDIGMARPPFPTK